MFHIGVDGMHRAGSVPNHKHAQVRPQNDENLGIMAMLLLKQMKKLGGAAGTASHLPHGTTDGSAVESHASAHGTEESYVHITK